MKLLNIFIITLFIIAGLFLVSCENDNEEYTNNTSIDKISIPESIRIRNITFNTDNNGLLCAGIKNTIGSIYKSNDGGNSWNRTYHSDSLSVNSLFYLNDTIVFACGDSLMLLKSVDAGENWDLINLTNYPLVDYYVPYYDIHANSEENIFVVGGEHFNKGIWSKTETGGYPWTHDTYDNQFYTMCWVSDYVGFFAGYGIIIVTEDGGNTFDYIDFEDDFFVDMEVDKNGIVYAVSDRGILYSTNDLGYNWTTEIDDYYATFVDMYIGEEKSVICGWKGVVYVKNNENTSWSELENMPNIDFYCTYINSQNEIFLGTNNGEIYILNKKRSV